MSKNGQNQWVVLLNKVPKGPLSEDEVKTLLNQGILRLNDVAYRVTREGSDEKPEWKLLWQYSEFNRRKPEVVPISDNPTGEIERRKKVQPEEIRRQAMTELPPDLMDISPEDLIPRSTSVQFTPEPHEIERSSPSEEPRDYRDSYVRGQRTELRWGVALTVLVAVSYGGLKLVASKGTSTGGVAAPSVASGRPEAASSTAAPRPNTQSNSPRSLAGEERRGRMQLPVRRENNFSDIPPDAPPDDRHDDGEISPDRATQSEDRQDRNEPDEGNTSNGPERREDNLEPEDRPEPRKNGKRRPNADENAPAPEEGEGENAPAAEENRPSDGEGGGNSGEEAY